MMKKNIVLLSLGALSIPFAHATNWTGYYAGVNVGLNSGTVTLENTSLSDGNSPFHKIYEEIPIIGEISGSPENGRMGVGSTSYGIQLGHLTETDSSWVLGWELSLNRFTHKRNDSPFIIESKSEPYVHNMTFSGGRSQIKFDAKLKGIIGYKIKEDFVPYVSLGASLAKIDYQIANKAESCTRGQNDISWSCENLADYAWGRNQLLSKHSYYDYGYNYGIGFFYALTDKVVLNMEISRTHMEPLNGYMSADISAKYTNYKLGLNYRF
ncbi:outer membrane protein with beta-barrel domain [Pasteurella langaaensis DSM 22999]|uniref:Outer membrane protein with beta-barrel domain n=1 Tax=Alitibacter langaaensis DSM 22999 TaxID=1122935 RepID=A0A2U0T8E5_9PAST|nr:outer membrane beta-barrel protein [Pasteurella langaaensis]PVX39900.1 outer membrane protein with beta-barrel domain [Pasteurella langaaensis DSM 22999]